LLVEHLHETVETAILRKFEIPQWQYTGKWLQKIDTKFVSSRTSRKGKIEKKSNKNISQSKKVLRIVNFENRHVCLGIEKNGLEKIDESSS
jgi:hypothetical protein